MRSADFEDQLEKQTGHVVLQYRRDSAVHSVHAILLSGVSPGREHCEGSTRRRSRSAGDGLSAGRIISMSSMLFVGVGSRAQRSLFLPLPQVTLSIREI